MASRVNYDEDSSTTSEEEERDNEGSGSRYRDKNTRITDINKYFNNGDVTSPTEDGQNVMTILNEYFNPKQKKNLKSITGATKNPSKSSFKDFRSWYQQSIKNGKKDDDRPKIEVR
jgi:hypothetical protein